MLILEYFLLHTIIFSFAQETIREMDFQYQGLCYAITDYAQYEVEVTIQNDSSSMENQTNYIGLDSVSIPAVVFDTNNQSYIVVGIGRGAFMDCYSLRKVYLPKTAKYILGWAFMGCRNLEYVSIPDHFEKIEAYAFIDCVSLQKPIFPPTTIVDIHTFMWSPYEYEIIP